MKKMLNIWVLSMLIGGSLIIVHSQNLTTGSAESLSINNWLIQLETEPEDLYLQSLLEKVEGQFLAPEDSNEEEHTETKILRP